MKVYIAHSSAFDYQRELYDPINTSGLKSRHEIFLPHAGIALSDTRQAIADADIVIAEISHPSTGTGIELGWASSLGKKIVAIHRKGAAISSSVRIVTQDIREYTPETLLDMMDVILRGTS